MTTDEVNVFAKTLIEQRYTTEEVLDFIEGIDRCLVVKANASLINRFVGKAKWNRKTARDIVLIAFSLL